MYDVCVCLHILYFYEVKIIWRLFRLVYIPSYSGLALWYLLDLQYHTMYPSYYEVASMI